MDFVKGPGNHPEARISRMVKTYEKDLLRLCCMYLKDTVMAEDAVQETFLKAYKSLHAFRGESSEKTWLMRIAINVCKDMQRTSWFRNLGKMVSIENIQIPAEQEMSISSELVSEIMKLPSKYKEVMASAMESFGKPGWPDFKPLLMYRMRNVDEYTITVRTCEEQEMIATDIPLCSLEQVLRNIEKKIEEGYIQEAISLSFGYSIYNDPAIQSKTPLAITDVKSYYAVPSWVLKCKFMKNPKEKYSDRTSATCLTINAQTGELIDYFDKSKFGFADADYKGFIPWDKVQ